MRLTIIYFLIKQRRKYTHTHTQRERETHAHTQKRGLIRSVTRKHS